MCTKIIRNIFLVLAIISFGTVSSNSVNALGTYQVANTGEVASASVSVGNIDSMVLIELTNKDRIAQGLAPLSYNAKLAASSNLKADDMAKGQYFSHNSPSGVTPWQWFSRAGYTYRYAGENLAVDFSDSASIETAWMNSPGHRANILNPNYTEIGISLATGIHKGRETTYVVQHFGTSPKVGTIPVISKNIQKLTPQKAKVSTRKAIVVKKTPQKKS